MTDLDDLENIASHELVALARRIDQLHTRWMAGHAEVEPGSSLDKDNRETRPYQLSHAVWDAISHAVDHLGAMKDHTVRGQPPHLTVYTRPYGAHPLLRAAYENASRAIWLLGPSNRGVRIGRRLHMLLDDARNRQKVVDLMNGTVPDDDSDLHEPFNSTLARRGIKQDQFSARLSYRRIVRGAADAMDSPPDRAEAIWSILSALSHGDEWASRSLTEREEVAVSPDGLTVTFKATTPIRNVESMTSVTVSLTEAAVRLFDQRRQRHT